MKQLPVNKTKPHLAKHNANEPLETGILADSLEVMEAHIQQHIFKLENSMNQLNLLDHPNEIISLCKEITQQRLLLAKVALKRKRASYLC